MTRNILLATENDYYTVRRLVTLTETGMT